MSSSSLTSSSVPDVLVRNEGTIFVFCPLTVVAKQFISENVHDALWFGSALVVETSLCMVLSGRNARGWAGAGVTANLRREKMKSKRVALYARVSTLNHGQNPEVQLHELRTYCERRGFEIIGEYVDKGISGSRERRPALDKLLTDCRKRLVDAVVVYRYDRFARSLRQLVNALEEFRSLGIDFISIHEGVDTSTPNGRLIFGIFASIAEFEKDLIRDRVCSGLAVAKAKGKHVGRPRVVVDVRRIESLRREGRSWAEITRETGISKGTAQRAQASTLPKTPVADASPSA